jgi:hypothetical protein
MEALFKKFPGFQKAYDERIEVDVNAGEAIFIPPFVWHYVVTDELSMQFLLWIFISYHQLIFFSSFLFLALAVNFAGSITTLHHNAEYIRHQLVYLHDALLVALRNLPHKHINHFVNTLEHLFLNK